MQTKEVTIKVSQEVSPQSTPQTEVSSIPDNAWLIVAVGIVAFLLLVGLRIFRSKRVVIDTPKVDITCDDTAKQGPS